MENQLTKKENMNNTVTISQIPFNENDYIVITETPVPTPTLKPTLTPTPAPKVISSGQLADQFTKYSNQYSVNRELLWKIGVCESGLNSSATNGIYGGMFQFSESSWITIRTHMNLPHDSKLRFDAEESIKTAAFKLSVGGAGAWPECGKTYGPFESSG